VQAAWWDSREAEWRRVRTSSSVIESTPSQAHHEAHQ